MSSTVDGAVTLIGRDDLIDRIDALILVVADRAHTTDLTITLAGPAGSGRSALLAVAAHRAANRGVRVLRAGGVDAESGEPYSALQELLLPVVFGDRGHAGCSGSTVLRVAIGLETGAAPSIHRVAEEVADMLRALLDDAPVLLLLDDLDRMDKASVDVLYDVAKQAMPRLAMIATILADGHGLAGGAAELVGPLDAQESALLLDARFPELAPLVRTGLLHASRGNPLALIELPQGLTDRQRRDDSTDLRLLDWTPRLERDLEFTIARLPSDTRRLLLLHQLDPSMPLGAFDVALGSGDALLSAIPAIELGWLEVIQDPAGQLVLQESNQNMSRLLASTVTPDEWATVHRSLGAVFADQPDYVQHIVAQPDPIGDDSSRAALLEAAGEAAVVVGDWHGAIDRIRRAVALTPTATESARRLARAAYLAGEVDMHLAASLVDQMRRTDLASSTSLTGALAIATIATRGHHVDIDMANTLVREALAGTAEHHHVTHARQASGGQERPDVVIDALGLLRWTSWLSGEDEQWAEHPDDVPTNDPDDQLVPVLTALRTVLILADDDCERGDFASATTRVTEARTRWRSTGFNLLGWACDAVLARVAAWRGDATDVALLTDRIARWAVVHRVRRAQAAVVRADVILALSQGNPTRALERTVTVSRVGDGAAPAMSSPSMVLDIVTAACQAGRSDLTHAQLNSLAQCGFGLLSARHKMIHLAAQAMISPDAQARTLYREALAVPDTARWRLDRARIQLRYGGHLRRNHSVAESREPLGVALSEFREMGCREWADRAYSELVAAGSFPDVVEAADGELTPREQVIAEAAATGLSNKMIAARLGISPRTVGNHLHHIYRKLAISSRGALRDALSAE